MVVINRLDIIDFVILCLGCLDKILFVGLLFFIDCFVILKIIIKNGIKLLLDVDVNLEVIVGDFCCDCYMGVDFFVLVREVFICVLRQEMVRQKSGNEKGEFKISYKYFEEVFKKVRLFVLKKD